MPRLRGHWPLVAAVLLAMLPALAAPLLVPGFVTQDGSAHLYNAEILTRTLRGDPEFSPYYEVRKEPLPNWSGHLLTMAMLAAFSPTWADRLLIVAMALGPALAFARLRASVAGDGSPWMVAAVSAMLALNITWLWGFNSFLLGVCLFPLTLAFWWSRRDRMGPGAALALASLLILGYFCHLISLGLTGLGLVTLCLATPGLDRRRLTWTIAGLAPMVPLALFYRSMTRRAASPFMPDWQYLSTPFSPRAWLAQVGWVDPISLASRVTLPFVPGTSRFYGLLTPVVPFGLAVAILAASTLWRRRSLRVSPWAVLGGFLCLAGFVGPDSFGEAHGQYLPQRVMLLGLVALLPWLDLAVDSPARRLAAALLALALVVQTATIWDYAGRSARTAGVFQSSAVREAVGKGRRVGTLLTDIKSPFRGNPVLHADNWLGLGTGNILWSNYETRHYYFPVQFRANLVRPPAYDFEAVALLGDDPAARARRWLELIDRYAPVIDVLLVWGDDPALDEINARWYEPVYREGPLRVLRRRDAGRAAENDPPGPR
ncbi:hypothetical protein EP7_000333 [Isosphaeraceae bacterium EP7]